MAENNGECKQSYFDGMTKLGKVHKRFLFIAAIAYFFDQMDLASFGFIAPKIMEELHLDMDHLAMMSSMSFWGMCIGGIFGGWLADQMGRKKALISMIAIFSISSALNGMTSNLLLFNFFRFTVGFGVIGMVVIAMVYMTEMMPSAKRGKYQALSIACGTMGIPLGALFANVVIPISPHSWRWVFFLGSAGIILIPLGMSWLKESPRWLVSKGRIAEAEAIVTECTGAPCDLSDQVANCADVPERIGTMEVLKIMFSKVYLRSTVAVSFLVIGVTLGVFYLSNWGTALLVENSWTMQLALLLGALAAFGTPLGDILASFVSDRGGRKNPIVIFCIISFVLCALLGWFVHNTVIYFMVAFMKAVCVASAMTMLWTYLAESFPTNIRSNATGIIFSSARAIAAVSMFTVPIVYEAVGFFGINVVNGLLFLVPAIIAYFLGSATAQKTLEEIEAEAKARV